MTLRSYQEVAREELERDAKDKAFALLFEGIEVRLKSLILLSGMEHSKPLFYHRKLETCAMQAEWFLKEIRALQRKE